MRMLQLSFLVPLWALSSVIQAQPLITNGSMTAGGDVPAGWETLYAESGKLTAARDTTHFHLAPASLRLGSQGGPANGNVSQALTGTAGKTFTLAGHLKSEGNIEHGAVALLIRDKGNKQIGWQEIATIRGTQAWRPFQTKVTIPPEGQSVLLMLYMKGDGNVWLDEVQVASQALPQKFTRSDDSPEVVHVGAVAPNILAIEIQAQRVQRSEQIPYEKQDGDEVEHHWSGEILKRNGQPFGYLTKDHALLWPYETLIGEPLLEAAADKPASFGIQSPDDSNYVRGVAPSAVFRKSKPNDMTEPDRHPAMRHTIYLKLPNPLKEGKRYGLFFSGLNVGKEQIDYVHQPSRTRSESVHVSQIGFRPDDPHKVAFLSVWLGTGGKLSFGKSVPFALLDDETHQRVFEGKSELAVAADQPEQFAIKKNHSLTDVHRMDFSEFKTPGMYRVYVDGIGCSYPFEIGSGAWEKAFQTSMQGFYHHRSGIELGPPHTDYVRPRCFHPDDGMKIYHSTCSLMNSNNGLNAMGTDEGNFKNLVTGKTDQIVPDAWGGYMDAGDWDRRIQHLEATRLNVELLELLPDYFSSLPLRIPENSNDLPDLLDEALFNLDHYRRMQTQEGGIRGGVESAEHPRKGEASWQESLDVMAYAPDLWSSHVYAGVAARTAHWLQDRKPELAKVYRDSALRAMEWAEKEYAAWSKLPDPPNRSWKVRASVNDNRNLAALEMYRLTADPKWHEVFKQTTKLVRPGVELFQWESHDQRDAAFLYARLPAKMTSPAIRKNAVDGLLREAQVSIRYGDGNAFGLTCTDPWRPLGWGFYGAPDAVALVRAHALTGDQKYLHAILRASQFAAGANPMNMTYTTGVGHNPPQNPLHVDSRTSGQPAPAGITVYGQFDVASKHEDDWMFKHFLNRMCTPHPKDWPNHEMYVDVYMYPAFCEYTIMQTFGPNSYVWGYLAGRGQEGRR